MLEKASPKEVKWGGGVYMDSERSRNIDKDKKNTAMLYSLPSAFSESSSEKGGSWRAWQIWLQLCCAVKALIPSGP